MSSKAIAAIFAALSLLQAASCASLLDVLAEYAPIVARLEKDVFSTIVQAGNLNYTAVTGIASSIANGTKAGLDRVERFKANIKKADEEAQAIGKNVKSCVAIAEHNLTSVEYAVRLQRCRFLQDFSDVANHINVLQAKLTMTKILIKTCLNKYEYDMEVPFLRSCFISGINQIKDEYDSKNSIIKFVIKLISAYSTKCVDNEVYGASNIIGSLQTWFTGCVKLITLH